MKKIIYLFKKLWRAYTRNACKREHLPQNWINEKYPEL